MTHIAVDIPCNVSCAFCVYLAGDRPYFIVARDHSTAVLVTKEHADSRICWSYQ